MFKVLVTALSFGKYSPEPLTMLKAAGCEVVPNPLNRPMKEQDLLAIIQEFDAIIVGVDPITAPVIEAASKLKVIAKHGVGVDNIDLAAAAKAKIFVTNAPHSNSEAVADLTMGLMLAVSRQIPKADATTKNGQWLRFAGPELYGKTLGIVGLGAIGKRVARRATGFSMHILAYDLNHDSSFAAQYQVKYVNRDDLLTQSDFISLHLPLTSETRGFIGERELRRMKNTAYLINTARGELVDDAILCQALQERWIAGAALDAFAKEPPAPDYPLWQLDQVVVTPHISAYSFEANLRMGLAAANSLIAVMEGRQPENHVNPW